ncbi:zinc finger protein CONSTANS-LIKE 13-like [Actinidia eriantha]|uniref:zinc finger protein CONSTANS-LIKE 13-like n=1 Tax=Actinidia eriantha TaxID=165200 RepID=UPI00258A26D4|nr:zinc finger protein CONSTANS-LIKE 13-like [Actinidia eriantha]XP_057484348.1 zinc finger protein CONSTANS-LIKE 13-like [Actinidia eriantha]XP_057484349.1 zinc finger protein CONSTANS-LIKE 13-like [Actinidia eriantha]
MTDPVSRPLPQIKEDEDHHNTHQRLCDFCGESIAILYCRADSAKLCFSCDREVHSTNQLFAKHSRSLLCDACDSSPASILCSTESSVLCHNCDWESHNLSLTSLHERRPLEGFTGCPSVNELLGFVGFQDLTKKALLCGEEWIGEEFGSFGSDGFSDLLVWDTPSIVTMDDLIASNSSEHSFQAMGVPPLPKNRKAACGQYKEEILSQLREIAKSEPCFSDCKEDTEPFMQLQSGVPEQDLQPGDMYAGFERGSELATIPSYKAGGFHRCCGNVELPNHGLHSKLAGSYVEDNCFLVPDKDSDIGDSANHTNCCHEGQSLHCVGTETIQVLPKVAARELTSQERDSVISRYKEKKKTRRYDKHIRYESRKVRAETRTRIKGRFAKMDQ